jgi:DNA-binding transcriptional ArsR family regulator
MPQSHLTAEFEATAELLRALAHPVRLQILHAVRERPLAVGEIEEATGIGQPGLSQQLSVLRKAELVLSQRNGKQVFYRVDGARMAEIAQTLMALGGGAGAGGTAPPSAPSQGVAPQGGAARFARVFR